MAVTTERRGIIHMIAYCDDCDWDDAWGESERSQRAVRQAAKRHVDSTGHTVTVETGSSTTYTTHKQDI